MLAFFSLKYFAQPLMVPPVPMPATNRSLAHPGWRLPFRSLVAAVIGGLLLGYGARLAYGCNIGAYFSGIASASVHGWLWLVAAFLGSVLGTYLRPWFGLSVEGNLARAQAGPTARD